MSEESTELAKSADLTRRTPADNAINVIKAGLNAVPVVGGVFASLLDDYIPQSQQKRIADFTEKLAQDLEGVQNVIDEEVVHTDEFTFLFMRVYQNVQRDYQQSKLDAYRNILVNSLVVDIEASVAENYLYQVERLTPMHLRVLSAFYSDHRNRAALGTRESGSLMQTLRMLLPEVAEVHIKGCVFDLDQAGITGNVSNSLMMGMTSNGATTLESRVTPLGRGFIDFINR